METFGGERIYPGTRGSEASEKQWDKKAKAQHQPHDLWGRTIADMSPGGKLRNENKNEVEGGTGGILEAFMQGRHMDLKALSTLTLG